MGPTSRGRAQAPLGYAVKRSAEAAFDCCPRQLRAGADDVDDRRGDIVQHNGAGAAYLDGAGHCTCNRIGDRQCRACVWRQRDVRQTEQTRAGGRAVGAAALRPRTASAAIDIVARDRIPVAWRKRTARRDEYTAAEPGTAAATLGARPSAAATGLVAAASARVAC
jgi:hypothetical protein